MIRIDRMPKTHLVNNETRNQYPVQANSDSPGMGMALPSYETAPPLDTDSLGPTTLFLAVQAIHAQTTDSPPLYRLSLGISDLTDLTTSVDLMRFERKGRSRPLYDLRHMRRTPGGFYPVPSESP
ncbi:hypothetical protein MCOR25_007557 [Pyricularia grisea]|nr:hypothetical protein MCOR25_007557 [Pyricularia grisea]